MRDLRSSEWVVLAYLLYLVVAAVATRLPAARLRIVLLASALVATLVVLLASLRQTAAIGVIRDWIPGLYVLAGFWLSGLFNQGANEGLEAWLEEIDLALFRRLQVAGAGGLLRPAVTGLLELAYLYCYAVVPGGIAVLYIAGHREAANAYWTPVLAAAYASYGTLPFFVTRPPRSIEPQGSVLRHVPAIRRLNLALLRHASIQVNTLPSGHAAVAFAAALALGGPLPAAGAAFGAVALLISIGAVAGRYHYAVDVVLGALVGVVAACAAGG